MNGRKYHPRGHIPLIILVGASENLDAHYNKEHKLTGKLNGQTKRIITTLKAQPEAQDVSLLAAHFNDKYEQKASFMPLVNADVQVLDIHNPRGGSDMGIALKNALIDLKRQQDHWDRLRERYSPAIFLLVTDRKIAPANISDHEKNRLKEEYMDAAQEIKILEEEGKLLFAAVGIDPVRGDAATKAELQKLTSHHDRIFLSKQTLAKGLDLGEPLQWLTRTIRDAANQLKQREDEDKDNTGDEDEHEDDRGSGSGGNTGGSVNVTAPSPESMADEFFCI